MAFLGTSPIDVWVSHMQYLHDRGCFAAASPANDAIAMRLMWCMALQMDRELKIKISEICSLLDVDGIRGDITTNKAARALAAYLGETTVTLEHVKAVIGLCLNHRYAPIFRIPACGSCRGFNHGPSKPCSLHAEPSWGHRSDGLA